MKYVFEIICSTLFAVLCLMIFSNIYIFKFVKCWQSVVVQRGHREKDCMTVDQNTGERIELQEHLTFTDLGGKIHPYLGKTCI